MRPSDLDITIYNLPHRLLAHEKAREQLEERFDALIEKFINTHRFPGLISTETVDTQGLPEGYVLIVLRHTVGSQYVSPEEGELLKQIISLISDVFLEHCEGDLTIYPSLQMH